MPELVPPVGLGHLDEEMDPIQRPLVLVADEACQDLASISFVLAGSFQTVSATNREQIVAAMEGDGIGVVVFALRASEAKSGFEMIREIQRLSPSVQIVVLSPERTVETLATAIELHCFAFLQKPGNPEEILRLVQLAYAENIARRRADNSVGIAQKARQREQAHRQIITALETIFDLGTTLRLCAFVFNGLVPGQVRIWVANDGHLRSGTEFHELSAEGLRMMEMFGWVSKTAHPGFPEASAEDAKKHLLGNDLCNAFMSRAGSTALILTIEGDVKMSEADANFFRNVLSQIAAAVERFETTKRATTNERLAWVSQFTAAIAHEVRAPLQYLSTLFTIAQTKDDPSIIRKETPNALRRLQVIEGAMADMMHCYSAKVIEFARVDLRAVVQNLVANHQSWMNAKNISLTIVDSAPDTPCVVSSQMFIERIITNFLVNAIHELERHAGSRAIEIEIQTFARGSAVIKVSDSGPGIPAGKEREMFTARSSSKKSGAGLGLSLSALLADRIGAEVGVSGKSEKLGGAVFYLQLPADAGKHASRSAAL